MVLLDYFDAGLIERLRDDFEGSPWGVDSELLDSEVPNVAWSQNYAGLKIYWHPSSEKETAYVDESGVGIYAFPFATFLEAFETDFYKRIGGSQQRVVDRLELNAATKKDNLASIFRDQTRRRETRRKQALEQFRGKPLIK